VVKIIRIGAIAIALVAALFLFVLIVPCDRIGLDQGCVNQGKDCPKFAKIICWLQVHLSWNSEQEPHFVMIGRPDQTHVGAAWPPHLVFNARSEKGSWLMPRIGFRYDRNWRGYIFPTIACKSVDKPLRY
jgi:hypothetical protein